MFAKLKNLLYFPLASYFRFFAQMRLKKWRPRIIVVTGSNGKTTLLHLLESQLGEKAKYSHHANSSFGVPFDILGLKRKTLQKNEWIELFLRAPFQLFTPLPKQKIYVVEADCDRPGEGKFLAALLHPEVVLWVQVGKSHSMNFDGLVQGGKFSTLEDAIAYEFGYFIEYCKELAIINGDIPQELEQVKRTKAKVRIVNRKEELENYLVNREHTLFTINGEKFIFDAMLPEDVFYSLVMCQEAVKYFDLPFDNTFATFTLPPGRSSIFKGIKGTTLIDSSYNLTPGSVKAILAMYNSISCEKKWLVIGDMLELGKTEKEEHENLANMVAKYTFDRILLMGPRVKKFTYPKLQGLVGDNVQINVFENPSEILEFLLSSIQGGETILFKAARFMEGVIEQLLVDKSDVSRLARREKIWQIRRKKWGL